MEKRSITRILVAEKIAEHFETSFVELPSEIADYIEHSFRAVLVDPQIDELNNRERSIRDVRRGFSNVALVWNTFSPFQRREIAEQIDSSAELNTKFKLAAEQRIWEGRYTIDEAALEIARSSSERIDEIKNYLVDQICLSNLFTYVPGSMICTNYGGPVDDISRQIKPFYDECFWCDLNDSIFGHNLIFKFPPPHWQLKSESDEVVASKGRVLVEHLAREIAECQADANPNAWQKGRYDDNHERSREVWRNQHGEVTTKNDEKLIRPGVLQHILKMLKSKEVVAFSTLNQMRAIEPEQVIASTRTWYLSLRDAQKIWSALLGRGEDSLHQKSNEASSAESALQEGHSEASGLTKRLKNLNNQQPVALQNEIVNHKAWLIKDPGDPEPPGFQNWWISARYFARELVRDDPALLKKSDLLAIKTSDLLAAVRVYKRGNQKAPDPSTIKKAFVNITFG